MKKISLLLILFVMAVFSFGQGKTLWRVSWAKPKGDQVAAFEAALKAHVQKFHPASRPMYVSENLTGEHAGSYEFVHGPGSWSQMDSMTPNPEHDADWEKNVEPKLAEESGNFVYRYVDSISYNNKADVDKTRMQFIRFKSTFDFQKTMEYFKKIKQAYEKTSDTRSYSVFIQQLAGNHPTFVFIYRYANWGQMEMNTYPTLKAVYEKEYGQREWDEFNKYMDDNVEDVNVYLRKVRPDLSTPPAK